MQTQSNVINTANVQGRWVSFIPENMLFTENQRTSDTDQQPLDYIHEN